MSTLDIVGPNTSLIPPPAEAWRRLDLAEILTYPTAFVSISQVNSIYSPDGAQADERQWERGSLEKTIEVANAARALDALYFWITYDVFRANYPKSVFDRAQYASWAEPFLDWDEERRQIDGELVPELRALVQPGDVEFTELALQSSFIGTPFELHLRRNGIQTIIFTGVHLDWCIEGNVRQARDLGYLPIVVGDATACEAREDEAAAMRRINNYWAPIVAADRLVELIDEALDRKER